LALWFQAEAALLKTITSGGSRTKIIALGIGAVDQSELRDVASSPQDQNVIPVQQFSDLTTVEGQLHNSTCTGKNADCILVTSGVTKVFWCFGAEATNALQHQLVSF